MECKQAIIEEGALGLGLPPRNKKIIYPDRLDMNEYADFSQLSTAEIKLEWIRCEKEKAYCSPDSGFQPLIDAEMRAMIKELKKRKCH